jgi:anti-sigma factor RsiW
VHAAARTERLEEQLLAAHVRSLIQDTPIQVASSDSHTVKPWFAGRVDFAPEVKDLTADGFPLLGGRLDYVDERRVGVLVYRRRLHVINVFMWPAASAEPSGPLLHRKNGYNILSWSRGGISYFAVSDVEPGELRRLQELL